ncbi:glycerophosphoryl diester phosphodiesterase [Paraburkholderia caballeronis]|uniref:glycerophosphodiester phosphodiesterase n=1 Tax=Paraburkholderia caballeronis TaxID=416943 RepID=UPI001065C0FA|nr:glycerophosphodiester phosphodiesterase [Paraburkholderia caballeronis]TDV24022.1 glycerophosphoryl diester phosphodiesterase [Paraburkholderia caballeronis]
MSDSKPLTGSVKGRAPAWPYPRVVAHRGGGTLAPENTLAGIRLGAQLGMKMVEFDAKLSADDVVFLLHDDTVDRTSNGQGAAARMDYASIARLDAGSWFDVGFEREIMPTLDQVASACLALGVAANIEIKPSPGRETLTGRVVAQQAASLWQRGEPAPLLSSFSHQALAAARDAAPALPRGLLFGALPPDWREQTESLDCVSLHVDHRALDEARVAGIKAAGLRILVYTVNELERARQLAAWGVDSICTDRIDEITVDRLAGA